MEEEIVATSKGRKLSASWISLGLNESHRFAHLSFWKYKLLGALGLTGFIGDVCRSTISILCRICCNFDLYLMHYFILFGV